VKNGKQVPQEVPQIKFGKLNIFIKKNCMVQPKYSPEEALQRIKLMMEYDSSKTLTENKETISEQYVAPTAASAVAGAGAGALYGSSLVGASSSVAAGAAGASGGAGLALVAPISSALGVSYGVAGAIVGGVAAAALLPLAYWLITKDTGANKVKKMFQMCSTDEAKIAKLPRKLQDTDLRSITDDIEDAIVNDSYGFQGGTDEEKLFGAFKQLESGTASDFCALVKYYNSHSDSGDLFDDLDSDIDAESEWKQIYRPIRNCVEDSLLTLKDESPKEDGKKTGGKTGGGTGGYKLCTGTYSFGCKSDVIAKVQGCLGLVADGKFGPKTKATLSSKGFTTFTDTDVEKICGKTQPTPTKDEFDVQVDADNAEDILNM
jgi:hypothetical protein